MRVYLKDQGPVKTSFCMQDQESYRKSNVGHKAMRDHCVLYFCTVYKITFPCECLQPSSFLLALNSIPASPPTSYFVVCTIQISVP